MDDDRLMPSSVRYLLFGMGANGLAASRMLLDEGSAIVGAYSRQRHVGADLGVACGLAPCGCIVQPASRFRARPGHADVALFFTTSRLNDLLGEALTCLQAGIRVLTLAEEAVEPWREPAVAQQIDQAAREGGAALLATGMNDVAMVHLPLVVAAMSHDVRRIASRTSVDLGHLGPAVLQSMGIGSWPDGSTLEPPPFSVAASVARCVAARAGATAQDMTVTVAPLLAQRPLTHASSGLTVATGQVCGIRESARARIEGGPEVEVELLATLAMSGEHEGVEVRVEGSPNLSLSLTPQGSGGFTAATAAIALNRVPTLMAAPPGLHSLTQFHAEHWRAPR